MLLSDVVKRLRLLAPLQFCEKWDNVGMLVESSAEKPVDRVLLTNDLTADVLNEAVQNCCQLIVSYHPFIFKPITKLRRSNWKERLILDCIQSDISVYSPHTSWDAVSWMNNLNIIKSSLGKPEMKIGELLPSLASLYPPNFEAKGMLYVNTFVGESFNQNLPTLYETISKTTGDEFAMARNGPEQDSVEVLSNYNIAKDLPMKPSSVKDFGVKFSHAFGCGLKLELSASKLRETDIIANIKHFLDLRYVRYSPGDKRSSESMVTSIAVCAGSGGSVLRDVFGTVDLVVTGEMSHHEVLDAKFNGTSVILTEHSNSERKFLTEFKSTVENIKLLPNCELLISELDKDPLDVY